MSIQQINKYIDRNIARKVEQKNQKNKNKKKKKAKNQFVRTHMNKLWDRINW